MTSPIRALIATAGLAVVAGCGSDSPSAPGTHTLDLSSILAQLAGGGVTAIPGAATAASGAGAVVAPAIIPSACVYSATTHGFSCPATTARGLTITASYWLFDAAGHAQTQPDLATTASVRAVTDVTGTLIVASIDTGNVSTVASHTDMTMSGLLTSKHVLNGTGTTHIDQSYTGTSTHGTTDLATVTTAVVIPADRSSAWPISGSQTVDAASTRPFLSGFTVRVHSVITYTGTNFATIAITVDDSITTTCKVDLSGKTPAVCT